MTELRRWADEGATPSELAALDEARSIRPSSDARKRMLAGVGVGVALGVTTASSAAAGTTVLGSVLGKALLATAVVVALSGAAWQYRQRSKVSQQASAHAQARRVAPAVAPPAPQQEPARVATAEPAVAPAALPPEPLAHAPAAAALAPSASLSDEVAALDRARRALDSRKPQEALKELEAYRKRFPRGALGAEQSVLTVEALLAHGDGTRAIALADRFAAAQPKSAYARRVQDLVKAVRTK
jgi:TolA-binding protein